MVKNIAIFAVVALGITACSPKHEKTENRDIITANMDTTVSPAEDFFEYANGGWFKNNPIPADETTYGIGELVERELRAKLRTISEEAMKKDAPGGAERQIGDFWYSATDSFDIEKNGIDPVKPELNKIAAIQTKQEVMAQAAHMQAYGCGVFYDASVSQDAKNSTAEAFTLSQGGLGLPNRDYYFNTDERTAGIRSKYQLYIGQIFRLLGQDSMAANQKAIAVVAMETKLAAASRKLADLRDPYKNYNKMAISSLGSLTPGIDWTSGLETIGVHRVDSIIIGQPEFFTALNTLVGSEDLQVLKDYMTVHLVAHFSPYLSTPFAESNFLFYGTVISGAQQRHELWRRALDAENAMIGEELGRLFVAENFDATAKARYNKVVENVRMAYKARMERLDWMDDSTRQKAVHKLLVIRKKVGYPDKWKDFSAMQIDRGPLVLNMMHAAEWWNKYAMDKLGKPVNPDEWEMTPQTYNAYYNPSNNEIVLPAAQMMVPGYADSELDDALVYGYTAASTIGHEITHGFDDEGRRADELGNLHNWWSIKDSVQFVQRSDVLVHQFNQFVPVDTMHINGRATLGENLADLGGILIGLDAFKQTDCYKTGALIHGQTPLQRFFLGYALGWLLEERQQRIATQLLTDVHAPAKYRVNGPLPNVPEFYEAFHVKKGDKMYLEDSLRVHLW